MKLKLQALLAPERTSSTSCHHLNKNLPLPCLVHPSIIDQWWVRDILDREGTTSTLFSRLGCLSHMMRAAVKLQLQPNPAQAPHLLDRLTLTDH